MSLVFQLTEHDIKILKTIYEMERATPEKLAQKLGEPYAAWDLTAYLNRLERGNLLDKVREEPLTYELSGLGLIAIGALPEKARSIFLSVPSDKCFFFYTGVGPDKFTGISACSLSDFREKVKTVDMKSLDFHIPRGDIERWVKDVLEDEELAEEIEQIRRLKLEGEPLRNRILNAIDFRIKELTSVFTFFKTKFV
ncbi:MAG: hypothetical protein H3Z52_15695 [archaeon]|nr:hypothetical protein [archaeon]